jgi:hypothetical protein
MKKNCVNCDEIKEVHEICAECMKKIVNENNDTIKFAVYLTGHDEQTIIQMYGDWKKNN